MIKLLNVLTPFNRKASTELIRIGRRSIQTMIEERFILRGETVDGAIKSA